jgi:hypothetical protein
LVELRVELTVTQDQFSLLIRQYYTKKHPEDPEAFLEGMAHDQSIKKVKMPCFITLDVFDEKATRGPPVV